MVHIAQYLVGALASVRLDLDPGPGHRTCASPEPLYTHQLSTCSRVDRACLRILERKNSPIVLICESVCAREHEHEPPQNGLTMRLPILTIGRKPLGLGTSLTLDTPSVDWCAKYASSWDASAATFIIKRTRGQEDKGRENTGRERTALSGSSSPRSSSAKCGSATRAQSACKWYTVSYRVAAVSVM